MFEQLVESTKKKKRDRRWRYFIVTAVVWVTVLSGIVISGVLAYDAHLEMQEVAIPLIFRPPLPARGPEPIRDYNRTPGNHQGASDQSRLFVFQSQTPTTIAPPSLNVAFTPYDSLRRGDIVPDQDGSGCRDCIGIPESGRLAEPPRPVRPRVEQTPQPERRIRVSSGPLQGEAIRRIEPPYPPLAKMAGVQGAVAVEVVIDERGNVISARALSGHALLKDAAEKAAWGWKWRPTTLEGVGVQVVGSITFNFTLH